MSLRIKKVDKRGQEVMGMPFSIIFAIILIIFFIVAAIIAIKIFWNPTGCGISDSAEQGLFESHLQSAIDEAWQSDRSDSIFNVTLSSKISHVCFFNPDEDGKGRFADFFEEIDRFSNGKNNFYLYPTRKACDDFRAVQLNHINLKEITKTDNPYCIENQHSFRIIRDFYGGSSVVIK